MFWHNHYLIWIPNLAYRVLSALLITGDCDSIANYFQHNKQIFLKICSNQKTLKITLFRHTGINNQPVILNNGDNNKACCSAFWVPPIKTHSWLPSCIAVWINYDLNPFSNFLSLVAYSVCHHCWDSYTDSWCLCVSTKRFWFIRTTFLKSFRLFKNAVSFSAESQWCWNQQYTFKSEIRL